MSELDIMKVIASAILGLFITMGLTACGVKAGDFVAGTTSYLREVNAGAISTTKNEEIYQQYGLRPEGQK